MSNGKPTFAEVDEAMRFLAERSIVREGLANKKSARKMVDSWLSNVRAEAIHEAADEAEQIVKSGGIAESAAHVPGECGRQSAIEQRDSFLEEPIAWLRRYAENKEERQETDS